MTSVINMDGHDQLLTDDLTDLSTLQHHHDQGEMQSKEENVEKKCGNHDGVCAVCLDEIVLQDTALVKGCEHAYCIQDYMFEESVCLLLRAKWFEPLVVEEREDVYEGHEDYYCYPYEDEEDDDLDDAYFSSSSVIRIGNRRWGDNGYVRGGRQEARPVRRSNIQDPGASSSGEPRKKEAAVDKTGRRAKRALKREAADKAAAEKHQQHLARLGRK